MCQLIPALGASVLSFHCCHMSEKGAQHKPDLRGHHKHQNSFPRNLATKDTVVPGMSV